MADVFISYANEDRPRAKSVADALERRGRNVFWDRVIPVGESFHDVIERAIDESRCMVVLWSQHAVGSNWVRNEAEEGERRGMLVPAQLEPSAIPLAFRHLQTADLSDWTPNQAHQQFEQLLTSIERVLDAEPSKAKPRQSYRPVVAKPVRAVHSVRRTIAITLAVLVITVVAVVGVNAYLEWDDARNAKHALNVMRESAEEGLVDNQLTLGDWYAQGNIVEKNAAEAMKWYRMAAEQGHADGQYALADGYAEGYGVRQDAAEAVRWFTKAAEQGHVVAQRRLGAFYAQGRGVTKDLTASTGWFSKAAEQGDVQSQAMLGFHYADGRGVAENDRLAVKWWRSAARQGSKAAQKQLRDNGLKW